jgi:catechol 2,3-dioxygenase
VIGLDLIMRYGSAALFMSAGGYHHHLGLNTWAGVNAPQPPDAIGLRYFTMELPKADEVGAIVDRAREAGGSIEERDEGLLLRDPFQHGVLLTAAESTSRQWKIAGDAR